MRHITKAKFAAAGLALFCAASANAGFYYVGGSGTTIPVPTVNDFKAFLDAWPGGPVTETFGHVVGVDSAGRIAIDYYGKEAGKTNQFWLNGGLVAQTGSGSTDPWLERPKGTVDVGAGTLDFKFCIRNGRCLSNLGNLNIPMGGTTNSGGTGGQSIATWISADGSEAWLLWDDSGANRDSNHDDMLIHLTFSSLVKVSEPASLALMGLALAGLGFFGRRRLFS